MTSHQLSPHAQKDSNSYGILGAFGSGNVKMLQFEHFHVFHQKSTFHQKVKFPTFLTFSLLGKCYPRKEGKNLERQALFHAWAYSSLKLRNLVKMREFM